MIITSKTKPAVQRNLIATSLGMICLGASLSLAGQHWESAPHRCVGCATGTCVPKSPHGYHPTQWRRWPGATDYEGFRRSIEKVDVPPLRIPDQLNEGRIEPRTRSNRPLEDTPGTSNATNATPSTVPVPDQDAGSNPFDNIVPNTELPNSTPADGFPSLDPPLDPPDGPNPADDLFNNPFNPAAEDEEGPSGPAPIDFGSVAPPTHYVSTSRAIRAIKNRRLALHNEVGGPAAGGRDVLVAPASFDTASAPQAGHAISETGEFGSPAGATPGPLGTAEKHPPEGSVLPPIGGNPLRQRQLRARGLAARDSGGLATADAVPQATVELKPLAATPELQSVTNAGRVAPDQRSLRETLRRNPLR